MKARIAVGLLLSALFAACTSNTPKKATGDPSSLLTGEIDSFKRISEIRTFEKDSLWKYIDGAADHFVELGFEKLATADYSKDSVEMTVEVYAFSSGQGPAKIYGENKSSDVRIVPVGDEGFVSEGLLMFRRGNLFVQINCYNPDAEDAQLIRLAKAIDKNSK
jgi:hypothetical protein